MDPGPSLQLLGKGKEKAKETVEVKLDVATDSCEPKAAITEEVLAVKGYAKLDSTNFVARAIYRVHSRLRDVSTTHYEPVLVSIGPYHHGMTPFQNMEQHKEHYLRVLLQRESKNYGDIKALTKEKIKQALRFYGDIHHMDDRSRGDCMVLDGFFLIELFRRNENRDQHKDFSNDKLFRMNWMRPALECDLLLFENQLPLFFLRTLFALTEKRPDTDRNFLKLALRFFWFNGEPIPHDGIEIVPLDDIPHLLGLVYEALILSKRNVNDDLELETPKQRNNRWSKSPSEYLINICCRFGVTRTPEQPPNGLPKSWEPIRTAEALQHYGVKFVKANDKSAFYDISFSDSTGELGIPRLLIDDSTECLFRNLVAYEQYSKDYHRVVDYLYVMDCLINSNTDVKLLRHCGIIDNVLGDDDKVSAMFNGLLTRVWFGQDTFSYTKLFNDVNGFCENRWNPWIAKLKSEYFSSPWSVISFIAAVLLPLLTITQTRYSILSLSPSQKLGSLSSVFFFFFLI